jgi:hypothetical protein
MDIKQPLIVFLDQQRLQTATSETTIKSWDFPKEIVIDGKIVNHSSFSEQFSKFLSTNHVGGNTVLVVLSDSICFTHTIKAEQTTEKEQYVRNFYDMVPVESATKREYEMGRDILLVASDTEFLKTVTDALISFGHEIFTVIPSAVLPEVGSKRWLDGPYVMYLIKNAAGFGPWSMYKPEHVQAPLETGEKETINKKNTPPYGLIAIFAVLVVVLVLLLIFRK